MLAMALPPTVARLQFPVLLWRRGYSYVATDAIDLCAHPRTLISETKVRASRGEFFLADSAGTLFAVIAFEDVQPFGGLKHLGHYILRSRFAAPTLREVSKQDAVNIREQMSSALRLLPSVATGDDAKTANKSFQRTASGGR